MWQEREAAFAQQIAQFTALVAAKPPEDGVDIAIESEAGDEVSVEDLDDTKWATVVGKDKRTAYQRLNGSRAKSKAMEFGEKVFYDVPRELRTKMKLRWRAGVYLGTAANQNKHYVSMWN